MAATSAGRSHDDVPQSDAWRLEAHAGQTALGREAVLDVGQDGRRSGAGGSGCDGSRRESRRPAASHAVRLRLRAKQVDADAPGEGRRLSGQHPGRRLERDGVLGDVSAGADRCAARWNSAASGRRKSPPDSRASETVRLPVRVRRAIGATGGELIDVVRVRAHAIPRRQPFAFRASWRAVGAVRLGRLPGLPPTDPSTDSKSDTGEPPGFRGAA